MRHWPIRVATPAFRRYRADSLRFGRPDARIPREQPLSRIGVRSGPCYRHSDAQCCTRSLRRRDRRWRAVVGGATMHDWHQERPIVVQLDDGRQERYGPSWPPEGPLRVDARADDAGRPPQLSGQRCACGNARLRDCPLSATWRSARSVAICPSPRTRVTSSAGSSGGRTAARPKTLCTCRCALTRRLDEVWRNSRRPYRAEKVVIDRSNGCLSHTVVSRPPRLIGACVPRTPAGARRRDGQGSRTRSCSGELQRTCRFRGSA
jgi:hypothetical protein